AEKNRPAGPRLVKVHMIAARRNPGLGSCKFAASLEAGGAAVKGAAAFTVKQEKSARGLYLQGLARIPQSFEHEGAGLGGQAALVALDHTDQGVHAGRADQAAVLKNAADGMAQ